MPFIRTKIVATVGPASADEAVIEGLVSAGCDVFRINFSHGTEEQHASFLETIRSVEARRGEPLTVMADLCGPKIRVGELPGGQMPLSNGDQIIIQRSPVQEQPGRLSTTLEELIDEVASGQKLLLDDGRIRLEVTARLSPDEVRCQVTRGGLLLSGKGINLPNTRLKLSALTDKDRKDAAWFATRAFDYVALSFVRTAEDVRQLRSLLDELGSGAAIVSKIEKPQALDDIDAIIDASAGIMVARGDLGVEMDLPSVPVAQKMIARKCQAAGKPCIIATQMLESMTEAPGPTRAEVSDVANAVLDCADAVMLSGETAMGSFPVEAVTIMNEVVSRIEAYHDATVSPSLVACAAAPTVAALAGAVRQIIESHELAAVGVFTASGTTARVLSKSRLSRPIMALCPDQEVVRKMGLYYGVIAAQAKAPEHTRQVLRMMSERLVALDFARAGDRVVVLSGRPIGQAGATNTLVVHTVT